MTRKEIRTFLKAGVDALDPVLEFGSGLITDFNAKPDKTLPQVWQELQPVKGDNDVRQAPIDDWSVRLHIAIGHNQQDVSADNYEDFIDTCDLVAQRLMKQYNSIVSGYKLVTLTDRTRTPFAKKYAHVMSGVVLQFTINSPDKTDLC